MNPIHSSAPPQLAGISPAMVAAAQIEHIDAVTAAQRCGITEPGTLIPYYDLNGNAVMVLGEEYARLRLDHPNPDTGQKYHQRAGTGVHAYLPPGTTQRIQAHKPWIIVIEGEKKALALADAGLGIPIGISGFYGFQDRDKELAAEFDAVLQHCATQPVLFYGDRDVIFNSHFSHAACQLSKAISPIKVYVSCVPFDAPGKGADDCREVLGDDFFDWFATQNSGFIPITCETKPEELAVQLLERRLPVQPLASTDAKTKLAEGCAKLAASLQKSPLQSRQVLDIATKISGFGLADIKRQVKKYRQERRADLGPEQMVELATSIDLGQPAGEWTRQVLLAAGQKTYLFGDNLCDFKDGQLHAHTAASLVPFIDSEDCCSFIGKDVEGGLRKMAFGEREARLVLGALRQHHQALRPVKNLAKVPVLAKTAGGAKLITGYCPETQILAPEGEPIVFPNTHDALVIILGLLGDFQFQDITDTARALVFLLTPALTAGGFLGDGRAPLFMVSKNIEGAGAGTLVKTVAAAYNLRPLCTSPENPKDAKEDLSKCLLNGGTFMYLDNLRGSLLCKLPFFESLLTEPIFTCRAPYIHGSVNVERCIFAVTSNGAVLSKDLASRTVNIRILKQPDNHQWADWPEKSLSRHVEVNRMKYLGAIYAIIDEWCRQGCPDGPLLSNFRCRQWEGFASWFWNTFVGSPRTPVLGDAHKTAQTKLADPNHDMLLTIFRSAMERRPGDHFSTSDLLAFAVEKGCYASIEKTHLLALGLVLKRHFPQNERFEFAGEFEIVRSEQTKPESNYEPMKFYVISPLRAK